MPEDAPIDRPHDTPRRLADLLDDIDAHIHDGDSLSIQDMIDAFGSRAFGPLIAGPAAILLTPIGAVPGLPGVVAIFVILISFQHVLGIGPWLPKRLTERSVKKAKWESGYPKARRWATRIDRFIGPRLTFITREPMDRFIGVVAIGLSVLVFPLGFVPFAVAAPGAALLALGLALSARDGLLLLLGLAGTGGSVWLVIAFVN